MAFGGGGNKEVMSDINVTPLCDIFVVLLIIFMLAADNMNQQGPAIDLPQRIDYTQLKPEEQEKDECNITIKDATYIYINGQEVTLDALPAKLQDILPRTAKQNVMVRTAPDVSLERTVKVIGIAYGNGAKSVGLGTQIRPLNN